MDSSTIRERFLAFFAERDHHQVPSSSLVANDPTLLLTNAGMNQFKPYFLGEQSPPFARAMSVQKCARTPDIDEVGKTARHLTFFEMLGNFSFGDYYKREACAWAWELVTEGFGIDVERLWITVFQTDDEAAEIWADEVGVARGRIVRRGKADNFWSMGVAGPCGPCSELFVDLGPGYGDASEEGPAGNEDRYVEIWNLVFMQNDCDAAIEPVADLPKKNIDTGAGVERLASVLQGVPTIYETDTIGGLITEAERLTGVRYGTDDRTDMALRILADHGRFITFLIADGVLPSNEGRGYVLRRVMRRAIRHARMLGRNEPVLGGLIDATDALMGGFYNEVRDKKDFIHDVAEREEGRFDETLRQGLSLLEREITTNKAAGSNTLPGDVAFKLHDTFGFPVDLTREIAAESQLELDETSFASLMEEQRTRARAARQPGPLAGGLHDAVATVTDQQGPTEFVGHEHLSTTGRVVALAAGADGVMVATEGDEVDVVLDRTSFYAEGGGQVGDRGVLRGPDGIAEVLETRRLLPGVTGHRVKVTAGEIAVGDEIEVTVDRAWRTGAERAHTATHILHWILRDRLGDHARQAGSLVEPGRLRFDFNHFDALSDAQIDDISTELQQRVLVDDHVRAFETTFDFAKSIGAMAIFGEKYGDFVRVVEVGEYSKELCGGTHVPHTARIGVVAVTSEGSVGANLRRVEALVGEEGLAYLKRKASALDRVAWMLKAAPDEVAEKLERLLATQKEMQRSLAAVEQRSAESDATRLADEAVDVSGTRLVVARRDAGVDALRALAQSLKAKLGSAVVVLGTAQEGRANLVAAVTKDLVERGISARDLLRPGAEMLGGGAGGKPELSISGGRSAERLDEALGAVGQAARAALAS
ncbi:MAG TPA: alanine--tRNA ligase [Actinomycetota bacterium]|nr:alanine--tRNA ligase [Actinomycetota bacterium]